MAKANLTYYLFEGVLVGQVNDQFFHITALSGGGAMSKKGITDAKVVNNPYMTGKQTTYTQKKDAKAANRGGPIPLGRYTIDAPSSTHPSYLHARLTPMGGTAITLAKIHRAGFLIHGSGPLGSDGCIVPTRGSDFTRLMDALKDSEGGTLHVLETMSGFRFA